MRDQVFVCYSHDDAEFVNALTDRLEPRLNERGLRLWRDTMLRPGVDWRRTINEAIGRSSAAILVLSQTFLQSDFIPREELPLILSDARTNGLALLCVGAKECSYGETPIASYQLVNQQPFYSIPEPHRGAELKLIVSTIIKHLPVVHLPRQRNPYFTGRDAVLGDIHRSFQGHRVQVICGLGAVGKTETAAEYCYRYRADYQSILWTSSARGLAEIAPILDLEGQDENGQREAVRRWLRDHSDWLLVLDDVDDPSSMMRTLPDGETGKVLITSHFAGEWPKAVRIRKVSLFSLSIEEARVFLLQRTGIGNEEGVDDLSRALGCLPLALEQAAAYIVEQGTDFRSYLEKVTHVGFAGAATLPPGGDDKGTVADTLLINLVEVEKAPRAADSLRLSAFLAPDAIPDDLLNSIVAGSTGNGSPSFDELLGPLHRYSLIKREPGKFSIHTLVQEAIRKRMSKGDQRAWATQAVSSVNALFPEVEIRNWSECERLLPHARCCAKWIDQYEITGRGPARLLNEVGRYVAERAHYREAERLYEHALRLIRQDPEQLNSVFHPEVLNNYATVLRYQDRHEQAAAAYNEALRMYMELGNDENMFRIAQVLNNKGVLCRKMAEKELDDRKKGAHLEEALEFLTKALEIARSRFPEGHWRIAQVLNNLGALYRDLFKLETAEKYVREALAIREKELGPDHPRVAQSLGNLAAVYGDQRRYEDAVPMISRALVIREQQLGSDHPIIAELLETWAGISRAQAEDLSSRAREMRKRCLAKTVAARAT